MSSVVVSAAVTGANNTRRSIIAPVMLNPFKKRRRLLDEEPITEETPLSGSESTERRAAEDPRSEINGYGSVDGRQVTGGERRTSNAQQIDGRLETLPRASGEERHEGDRDGGTAGPVGGQKQMRQLSPTSEHSDEEDGDLYLLTATPYRFLVRLFALVPLASLFTILVLILVLHGVWSSETWSATFTSYMGLSVFAAATWIVSFALRIPLYLLSSLLCRSTPAVAPFMTTLVQVFIEEALRMCALILVHIHLQGALSPSDPTFPVVWALGIGWATAEVAVSVWQGYEQLALYKDVLSPDDPTVPSQRSLSQTWILEGGRAEPQLQDRQYFEDPEGFMHEGIDRLVRVRARIELEQVYGIPFPNIPVFISCLQRIDSIVLSLALFLLISSSYLSNLGQPVPSPPLLAHYNFSQAIWGSIPTFLIVAVLHTSVAFIWTANVLPRIGIHSASYIGSVVALGSFFAGLGQWDAL